MLEEKSLPDADEAFLLRLHNFLRKTYSAMVNIKYTQLPCEVERTGLEPVTSALSKQRSEPTELAVH